MTSPDKFITIDSLNDLVLLDDVRVSPDGTRAVFTRTTVDRSGNKYNRTIWIKRLDDPRAPAEPLTGSAKDSMPRWSPDGMRLAFLSGRDDKPALFVLPMREGGGEARSIATHPNGISAFEWAPDGTRIAYTAAMRQDECEKEDTTRDEGHKTQDGANVKQQSSEVKDSWELKREKEQKQHDEELRLDPRVIERFPYRTGTTYMEDRVTHIYVTSVPTTFAEPNKAKPERITPSDGRASFRGLAWSADARFIYSTLTRDPDNGEIFRYADVVRLTAPFFSRKEGEGGPRRTFSRIALPGYTCFSPLPSPDGKWVAVDRSFDNPDRYEPGTIALIPTVGYTGKQNPPYVVDVSGALDRTHGGFQWSRDGKSLYFTLLSEGATNLYRAHINGRKVAIEQITRATHEIDSFDVGPDGVVVYTASTGNDPSVLSSLAGNRTRQLFAPNRNFVAEHRIGPVEAVRYINEGRKLQGWLIMPPNFDPKRKYPLVVQMHGGPHVMWGAATRSIWHEFQAVASAGYCVFWCNPRGSDGYGRDFWHSNRGDWGDGPMRDVLAGVDIVSARDYIDRERLCLTGGSYAGYLTAWIIGKDHRFAAACSQRGVYNLVSMRNTTDIPFFNDRETGGVTPWDDVEALWRMSPISLVPTMQTPLLIEHSEQDYRVPIEQAEQLFQALKLMKKTVKLVRWPREGHELSRAGEPRHRAERIRHIIEWFDEYTRK
jgi:dipeptidyl aminopeptidase/acylaminoacyl peptidase